MEWIKENVVWIKDLFWIIFTLVATIVSIKTYQKAKKTVLQPLKTEVIKRQTDILVSLLDFLGSDNDGLYNQLDYIGIIQLNISALLKEYGYITKGNQNIGETKAGAIILKKEGILSNVELPKIINGKKDEFLKMEKDKENDKYRKEKYYKLKQGIIDIEYLYFSIKHSETIEKLREYCKNPFLPADIQKGIKQILNEINYNLTEVMKIKIEDSLKELAKNNEYEGINIIGVYNSCQREFSHHRASINKIELEIREYLMVDDKWI